MTDKTWTDLQREVTTWALHNFGEQEAWQPMLGLTEEVAEFIAARESTCDQGASTEQVLNFRRDRTIAMEDAIGDQCIYALNLCQRVGLSMEHDIAWNGPESLTDAQLLGCLGLASHAVLKHAQGIRGFDDIKRRQVMTVALSMWFRWASGAATRHHCSTALHAAQLVWAEVQKRDWRKNPMSANLDAQGG